MGRSQEPLWEIAGYEAPAWFAVIDLPIQQLRIFSRPERQPWIQLPTFATHYGGNEIKTSHTNKRKVPYKSFVINIGHTQGETLEVSHLGPGISRWPQPKKHAVSKLAYHV